MAERVSRGIDGFARRQALARLVSHLTNPALIAIPLVGWAQVERGRHTAGQVVAGALLSAPVYGLGFGP